MYIGNISSNKKHQIPNKNMRLVFVYQSWKSKQINAKMDKITNCFALTIFINTQIKLFGNYFTKINYILYTIQNKIKNIKLNSILTNNSLNVISCTKVIKQCLCFIKMQFEALNRI